VAFFQVGNFGGEFFADSLGGLGTAYDLCWHGRHFKKNLSFSQKAANTTFSALSLHIGGCPFRGRES
jgi:hypothetical protein